MQKRTGGLNGRGQYGRVCPCNGAAVCSLLLLALGIVIRTVPAAGCGQPTYSQRVVGGQDTLLGKWPWQVSIVDKTSHVCGGSLISETWVASAAHCVSNRDSSNLYVMMGILNLTGPSNTRVIIYVKNYLIQPIYNGHTTSGDLALIELKSPVTYTVNIQPICLPSPNQDFPDGMKCWLTGWGTIAENVQLPQPFTLQEVDLPLINSSACDEMFQAAYGFSSRPEIVKDDMLCAGYPEGGKDGCQGDSGGPLACQLGKFWWLVGVVSWGVGCAKPGIPGVYTKITSFVSWIREQANITDTAVYEKTSNVTTIKIDSFTTKNQTGAVQSFTVSETIHESTTAAGLGPHVSMSLLITAVVLGRVL